VARGARAVLYERDGDTGEQPRSCRPARSSPRCRSSPSAPASIADRFFGAPSQQLTVAGITGTNGKTTCAWLLAQALAALPPAGRLISAPWV